MVWLVLGVALWCVVHLSPSVVPGGRAALVARLGVGSYKWVFVLLIAAALVLMVIGWQAATPQAVYAPPPGARTVAGLLMLIAFLLFPASRFASNIRRAIRHPQLTAVALWATAHLIANGDDRALVLFGALGAWALVEMALINRREGAWVRPEPRPVSAEVKPLAVGLVLFFLLLFLHPYLFGASPFAG